MTPYEKWVKAKEDLVEARHEWLEARATFTKTRKELEDAENQAATLSMKSSEAWEDANRKQFLVEQAVKVEKEAFANVTELPPR